MPRSHCPRAPHHDHITPQSHRRGCHGPAPPAVGSQEDPGPQEDSHKPELSPACALREVLTPDTRTECFFTAAYPVEIFNEISIKMAIVRLNHESQKKISFGLFSSSFLHRSVRAQSQQCPRLCPEGAQSPPFQSPRFKRLHHSLFAGQSLAQKQPKGFLGQVQHRDH